MFYNDWEIFYTTSKSDENLFDKLSLNSIDKIYILNINCDEDKLSCCHHVSRDLFDMLISGLRNDNFVEYVAKA